MKYIVFLLLIVLTSCGIRKSKVIASTYANDTLSIYTAKSIDQIPQSDITKFTKIPHPTSRDIQKYAFVEKEVADSWIKQKTSNGITLIIRTNKKKLLAVVIIALLITIALAMGKAAPSMGYR